jgi:hypothetical protein
MKNPSPTKKKKKKKKSQTLWLTPVILATQEAEIRRITVCLKPAWENSLRNFISKKKSQKRVGGVA